MMIAKCPYSDIGACIARTYITSQASNNPARTIRTRAPPVLLSFVEPCIGIVCACLPVMRPLLIAIKGFVSKTSRKFSRSGPNADSSRMIQSCPRNREQPVSRPTTIANFSLGEGPFFTDQDHCDFDWPWPLSDEKDSPWR